MKVKLPIVVLLSQLAGPSIFAGAFCPTSSVAVPTSARQTASVFSSSQFSSSTNTASLISKCSNFKSSTCRKAVEGDFDPEALSRNVEEAKSGSIKAKFRAMYKFSRPHTIRGSILASIAGTIRALSDTPGAIANANWGIMLPRAIIGMIALLMGNVFIVGINQIYDEDIDKLNKPFLPVASGEMSKRFAWAAVMSAGLIGPVIV
jgi:hypothetical protein